MKHPKTWKLYRLGDLFSFKNGLNGDKSIYGSGVPFINVLEIITNRSLVSEQIPGKVIVSSNQFKEFSVIRGDVLFNRTSETATEIALTSVYLDDTIVVFGGFVIRARPKTSHIDDFFKKFCFDNDFIRSQVIRFGKGAIRTNIGQEELEKINILLPPIREQKKIADILTTWDKAIDAQIKLIAAKETQKKALMQKLLSGEVRFKGFKGEWKRLPFGEVFEFVSTQAYSRDQLTYEETDNEVFNVHYGDIHATFTREVLDLKRENPLPKVLDAQLSKKKLSLLKDGDLIIADVSEDYEGVGESVEIRNIEKKKVVGGLHVYVARDKKGETVEGFRAYLFRNPEVSLELKKLATGVSVYSISKTALLALHLVLPSVEEQKFMAKLFYELDEELYLLSEELDRMKKQKKGLMQNLLTGKILVKV